MYNYNNENNNERSTRQFMEGILNGDIPVRRQNPRPGQSEYYYLHGDTENNDVLSNGIEIDVPNPYTPNPMKMQAGQTMANPSLSPTAGMNNPFGNRNSAYTGATGQAGANSMPGVGAYAQTGQAWGSMGQSGMNGNMFSGYQPYDERNGNAARMAQGYGNGTAQAAKDSFFIKVGDTLFSGSRPYDILREEYDNMKRANLINGDDYYHSLAMCRVGQMGDVGVSAGLGLGLLREGTDILRKTSPSELPLLVSPVGYTMIPFTHTLFPAFQDSAKDMKNNLRALNYGYMYPNADCYGWAQQFYPDKSSR